MGKIDAELSNAWIGRETLPLVVFLYASEGGTHIYIVSVCLFLKAVNEL
jgi:hypothetical protein